MNKTTLIPFVLRQKTAYYCDKMARVSGFNPVEESKRRPVVTARVFVAYRLLLEGFTEHAVGEVLGWDHSTINHYRRKAATMLTAPGYNAERELWNKFNDKTI